MVFGSGSLKGFLCATGPGVVIPTARKNPRIIHTPTGDVFPALQCVFSWSGHRVMGDICCHGVSCLTWVVYTQWPTAERVPCVYSVSRACSFLKWTLCSWHERIKILYAYICLYYAYIYRCVLCPPHKIPLACVGGSSCYIVSSSSRRSCRYDTLDAHEHHWLNSSLNNYIEL